MANKEKYRRTKVLIKRETVSSNGGTSFFLSIEEFILFESKDERGGKRESFNEEPRIKHSHVV